MNTVAELLPQTNVKEESRLYYQGKELHVPLGEPRRESRKLQDAFAQVRHAMHYPSVRPYTFDETGPGFLRFSIYPGTHSRTVGFVEGQEVTIEREIITYEGSKEQFLPIHQYISYYLGKEKLPSAPEPSWLPAMLLLYSLIGWSEPRDLEIMAAFGIDEPLMTRLRAWDRRRQGGWLDILAATQLWHEMPSESYPELLLSVI